MTGLHHIHNLCLSRHLSFVSFRLPQQDHSTTYIQSGQTRLGGGAIHDLSGETGFIMAPFDTRNGHPYHLIRPDLVVESNQISRSVIRQVEEMETGPPVQWSDADSACNRKGTLHGTGEGDQILHFQRCFPESGAVQDQGD